MNSVGGATIVFKVSTELKSFCLNQKFKKMYKYLIANSVTTTNYESSGKFRTHKSWVLEIWYYEKWTSRRKLELFNVYHAGCRCLLYITCFVWWNTHWKNRIEWNCNYINLFHNQNMTLKKFYFCIFYLPKESTNCFCACKPQ